MTHYSLLHLEKTAWQLVGDQDSLPRETFAPDALVEQAPLIVEALAQQSDKAIVLGLDANWCLTPTLEIASPQMLRKPQLLHYQLEEWIPWSAEEYVSDFIGHRDRAFCVAMPHQELSKLLQALEAEDIAVAAVVPLTLLALDDQLVAADRGDHRLLWQHENTTDLLTIRQGQLLRWSRVPSNATELTRHLNIEQLTDGESGPLYTLGLSAPIDEAVELPAVSQLEAATRTSRAIISGQHESTINLGQGELRSKQSFEVLGKEFGRLKLAVALLLVTLAAAFWLRSRQYEQAVADVQSQLTETYTEVFPGRDVPERIGVAINNEYRQLQGTRAPAEELPAPVAADTVLENVLQHLPPDLRFRLPEIRIDQDRVTLGGEVRSNAAADQLAAALRKHGFNVDPPRMQRLAEQGFGVRLQAKVEDANP